MTIVGNKGTNAVILPLSLMATYLANYLAAGSILAALSIGILGMNVWYGNHRSRLTKIQRDREDREDEREAILW